MRAYPEHGICFTCGSENPHGIGMHWFLQDDGSTYGEITLSESQQGPPGHAHGGASAALLDEAMGLSVWAAGHHALAVNLNVDFRKMVPLGQPITVTGRVVQTDNRKVFTEGELRLPDGEIAATGRGIYVEADDKLGDVHYGQTES